jgi:hypothetical protein
MAIYLFAILVIAFILYMLEIGSQQRYCEKLDQIQHLLPHLRSRQPAADSGPHETRWGYGLQDCYMKPRHMWKHLKAQGILKTLGVEI